MIKKEIFGKINSEKYYSYTLINENLRLTVSDMGAHITHLWVKDRYGNFRDIVLGFSSLKEYSQNTKTYFGATVGRSCNRIANASFTLEGKTYKVKNNEGGNNLHSGPNGYQLRKWDVSEIDERKNQLTFTLISPSGDQGFPGTLIFHLTYQLTENAVVIKYEGISDSTTIFNPTNHSYFNLNGHNSGTILNHELKISADFYTPIENNNAIPTGEILRVENTPFNFKKFKKIGAEIDAVHPQLQFGNGYDHNFVITGSKKKPFASVKSLKSGIRMDIYTNLPGVQFYSGNLLNGDLGKDGMNYKKRSGFCLETQYFPNSINTPTFQSPVLLKNTFKKSQTKYVFIVQ